MLIASRNVHNSSAPLIIVAALDERNLALRVCVSLYTSARSVKATH